MCSMRHLKIQSNSTICKTSLHGCFEVSFPLHSDSRGQFVKPYQMSIFEKNGINVQFKEEFYTVSKSKVLRGFHFQSPPQAQEKLVYLIKGSVLDVILDLNENSPTFGHYEIFRLNEQSGKSLYIPQGMAHAFYVLEGPAILVYKVTSEYNPALDQGVHWKSVGVPWPDLNPILSERDRHLPHFRDIQTPFRGSKVA